MARNRVKLIIGGTEYSIVSDEPIAYVSQLGREIDEQIAALTQGGRMTTTMAAVLTAITERDKMHKAEAAADHLRDQIREYLAENNALRAEMERLHRE